MSATGSAPGSCTGSTARRAGCSSSRARAAYESLVAQLSGRTVDRCYQALVWGVPAAARGIVDAPIGRSETRRTRMAVRSEGRPARTAYEVQRSWSTPVVALVECKLETGRTHQIRVHLAAIGHPIVGDGAYRGVRDSLPLHRPFLHAGVLAFDHPGSGERLRFDEPSRTAPAPILARTVLRPSTSAGYSAPVWLDTGARCAGSSRAGFPRLPLAHRLSIRYASAVLSAQPTPTRPTRTVGRTPQFRLRLEVADARAETRSARVKRSSTLRVSSESSTHTSWSTQWPSQ